eukprot:scaffold1167_cov418-Prasinococcus_capsulatus_cf.AAC.19
MCLSAVAIANLSAHNGSEKPSPQESGPTVTRARACPPVIAPARRCAPLSSAAAPSRPPCPPRARRAGPRSRSIVPPSSPHLVPRRAAAAVASAAAPRGGGPLGAPQKRRDMWAMCGRARGRAIAVAADHHRFP